VVRYLRNAIDDLDGVVGNLNDGNGGRKLGRYQLLVGRQVKANPARGPPADVRISA
jgi:hypothetical protein